MEPWVELWAAEAVCSLVAELPELSFSGPGACKSVSLFLGIVFSL